MKEENKSSITGKIIRLFLGSAILGGGIYLSLYWINNKPRAKRKPPQKEAALVEVKKINKGKHQLVLSAMGTVIPSRKIDISSRITGEITKTGSEFYPGGFFKKGELIADIDKADYLLMYDEAKLAIDKADLLIEQNKLTIEQSELTIKQNLLAIEQSTIAIKQSDLLIEQSKLSIEQADLTIEQRKADIIKVEKDLTLEEGQQKVAKREFAVLEDSINSEDSDLILRKPHIKAALASLDSAKARLKEGEALKKQAEAKLESAIASKEQAVSAKKQAEAGLESAEASKKKAVSVKKQAEASKKQAELNLEKIELSLIRTRITAPFDAVVDSKKVDKGSQVNIGTPIISIIDTNEYWIEVSVSIDNLKWIKIPDSKNKEGSKVKIYHESAWGKDVFRTGIVKRLTVNVEPQDRMAKLLISIKDPLCLTKINKDSPKMILGTFVRVEIEGDVLNNVFKIERSFIHNNKETWIYNPNNTLDIRNLEIVWKDNRFVFISGGLKDEEMIITSDLASPVQGMELRMLEK